MQEIHRESWRAKASHTSDYRSRGVDRDARDASAASLAVSTWPVIPAMMTRNGFGRVRTEDWDYFPPLIANMNRFRSAMSI